MVTVSLMLKENFKILEEKPKADSLLHSISYRFLYCQVCFGIKLNSIHRYGS